MIHCDLCAHGGDPPRGRRRLHGLDPAAGERDVDRGVLQVVALDGQLGRAVGAGRRRELHVAGQLLAGRERARQRGHVHAGDLTFPVQVDPAPQKRALALLVTVMVLVARSPTVTFPDRTWRRRRARCRPPSPRSLAWRAHTFFLPDAFLELLQAPRPGLLREQHHRFQQKNPRVCSP